MSEQRPFPVLRPGESVTIEPVTFGHVERAEAGVKVEARASGRLTITVRGHGRIWDMTIDGGIGAEWIASALEVGLAVVRWTPADGPEPGTTRCP